MNFKRMPLSFAAAALATFAIAPVAQAQNLQALYEAARAFDPAYQAARALASSAQFKVDQSDALLKPTAAVVANATLTQLGQPRIGTGDSNSIGSTVNGKYPLFNRANAVTVEQSRKGLEVAQADLDTAEQDLIIRLAQAYFDVLASQDTYGTTLASKKAITEQLASAKRNFEVGTATITDTREAQARFDLATAQELAAENDLRTKRIALDQLVGRSSVAPKPLAVPVTLPAVLPANAEEWVTAAMNQHPSMRRARVGHEVAKLETSKAKAGEAPTVDAVGSVGLTRSSGSSASLPGFTRQATVGVQLNMPLYTGGAVQGRISETLALEEKSRLDIETARGAISQGTRVAYFGVVSGKAQVAALEAAESSTKLALEATQLGYKVGVRVNLDVLNAQTQLFQTQRDLAKARYDVLMGGLRLRQASGQLMQGDLEAVNQMIAK